MWFTKINNCIDTIWTFIPISTFLFFFIINYNKKRSIQIVLFSHKYVHLFTSNEKAGCACSHRNITWTHSSETFLVENIFVSNVKVNVISKSENSRIDLITLTLISTIWGLFCFGTKDFPDFVLWTDKKSFTKCKRTMQVNNCLHLISTFL